MGWPEVGLASINMLQVVALAWIANHQRVVKRDLEEFNGTMAEKVDAVPDAVLEAAIRRGVEIEIARAREQK